MPKPYNRQQIQTNKVLSSISDTYYRNVLEQILTHKDTLYNIILGKRRNILLRDIITNTDSVVIVITGVVEPLILDKNGGDILVNTLNILEDVLMGTEYFTVHSGTKYIIETNYKSVYDVYVRLPIYS